MVAKEQRGSTETSIEIWREGDSVLIGVPSAEVETGRIADLRPLQVTVRAVDRPVRLNKGRVYEILAPLDVSARREARDGRVEAQMLTMTEEEWLVANLLALQREAVELTRSLDETRAYVAEKCAAVEKS